ncbi:hypothetical protein PGT21_016021 [Puccinia graminis f. sp. tritici]|uniref:Uncharacterized protein n=1 Tax=Puccinia graminis f. sp. tritici TaxID=56615 RepID=A0A5B0LKQ2_PUCGR|nr:hypothetical protein PGT21_016021 [Puccinia graminis f. sp. tritici]
MLTTPLCIFFSQHPTQRALPPTVQPYLPPPASPSLHLDKPIKIGSSSFLSSLDDFLPSLARINRQPTTNTGSPPPSSELSPPTVQRALPPTVPQAPPPHRPAPLLNLA